MLAHPVMTKAARVRDVSASFMWILLKGYRQCFWIKNYRCSMLVTREQEICKPMARVNARQQVQLEARKLVLFQERGACDSRIST
jgi:hypothetical protein